MVQGATKSCSGGQQGQEHDAQRLALGHVTSITSTSETPEGSRGEKDPRNNGSSASASSLGPTNAPPVVTVVGGGGSQEQEDMVAPSPAPVQPTRLFVCGDNASADGPGTVEGGSNLRDPRNVPPTAPSPVPTKAGVGTGSDPAGLEGSSVEGNTAINHSIYTSSIATAGVAVAASTGGSSSGGGGGGKGGGGGNSDRIPPGGSDVGLDSLFGRLRIDTQGGAGTNSSRDDNRKDKEQLASLHTKIQDLEMYLHIEVDRRLQAERLAQQYETELRRTADRCDTEIAAREKVESNAKNFASLCAEARTAWKKTQDMVQNKERELAAAEAKMRRESKGGGGGGGDDCASLQRRLEDARKANEADRQYAAALKIALEGGSGSPSLRSPAGMTAAFGFVAGPPAETAGAAWGNVGGSGGAADGDDGNIAATIHTKAEHRVLEGQTEILFSPNAKLEGDRKAAAEARLEAAIDEAGRRRRSKMITAPVLLDQKARLKHAQQQLKADHAEASPRREKATPSNNSQLSPSAPSYFPPCITAAALQKAREQHDPPQTQDDNNPAMPLLDLDWEEPSVAETEKREGDLLIFAAPSPDSASVPGMDFFPEPPLPPRPHASPAANDRGGAGGDGDEGGCGLGLDGAGSPVRLVLPPLSFSDVPAGHGVQEGKRTEAPQTQPHMQSPAAFHQELEEIYMSDEEGKPNDDVGPLSQMLAISSLNDTENGTETTWSESRGGGKSGIETPRDGPVLVAGAGASSRTSSSSYGTQGGISGGIPANIDGIQKQATAAAMPLAAGSDVCSSGEEEEKKTSKEVGENDGDTGECEERDDVVRRAVAFLQALETEGHRSTMTTLEVDLGLAVSVMSERKFLELHDTKVRTTERRGGLLYVCIIFRVQCLYHSS